MATIKKERRCQVSFPNSIIDYSSPKNKKIEHKESTELCSTRVSLKQSISKRLSIYDLEAINNFNNINITENKNTHSLRKDYYGSLICKGKKTHKVTFIDNISNKKLAEVILVDDYDSEVKKRKYNKNSTSVCTCSCLTV